MSTTDEEIAAITTAPRVTPDAIRQNIQAAYYFTAYEGALGERFHHEPEPDNDRAGPRIHDELRLLTLCVLVLSNGFTVLGKSACAHPENFNQEIGRKVAYDDAFDQCFGLLGFELKSKLDAINRVNDGDIDEALTRMTAMAFGNGATFTIQDADRILGYFNQAGAKA